MVRISLSPVCPSTGRPTDRRSKVFDPTTIELRFQYLSKFAGGPEKEWNGFVPVTVREATPEDGPSCVPFVFIFAYRILRAN